jgi:hypothetical protein
MLPRVLQNTFLQHEPLQKIFYKKKILNHKTPYGFISSEASRLHAVQNTFYYKNMYKTKNSKS